MHSLTRVARFVEIREIALVTGFGIEETKELVARMDRYGLLEFRDQLIGPSATVLDGLQAVAVETGTEGAGLRDRQRHDADRATFHARGDVNVPEVVRS